jgi:hypothetical protein
MLSMSNADLLDELADLQRQVETASITIEEAGPAFERLTYLLTNVNRDVDQALRDLVNDSLPHSPSGAGANASQPSCSNCTTPSRTEAGFAQAP